MNNLASLILAVDAGNTKTVALLARLDGTIIGAGRSGCGDIYTAAHDADIPAVYEAVQAALSMAGATASQVKAGGFNMAGADYPEDYAFIEAAMQRYGYGRTITVVNDAIGPLWAGSEDGSGVAVICGTGAATGARGRDGRLWHSSFWQEPTGGHQLGHKTLAAVYRAELGLAPPTQLSARVTAFFGVADVATVLHHLTARGNTGHESIRHLAAVLLDVAEHGDATARQIIHEHGAGLGEIALVAARNVGIAHEPFTLVLAGGVLRHPSRLLADALVARVQADAPAVRPVINRFEPVVGALFMALREAGIAPNDAIRARLNETLPSPMFFKSDM